MFGSAYGGYAVALEGLSPESIVYSVGVGEDVSFDLGLIAKIGAHVHAFDPTPRSIRWVEAQALPDKFHFHPYGIAAHDGTVRFNPPLNPTHVSHTVLERSSTAAQSIEVPVSRLATVMEQLGHQHIDVLKLDIEGAEYEVIDQMLDHSIYPTQLVLEYHHQFENVPLSRTERSLDRLLDVGYRIFHISPRGHEFSLLRTPPG